jgi:aspartate aminotransferase
VALCNPGDEVILPAPYWVSYIEMIQLADGVPVIVDAKEEDEFEIKASAIEAAITPKTKVIILNSPSNPSGGIISEDEFRKIGDLAVKHNLYIISDEMYEQLLYEDKNFSIASISEEICSRTVTINGASKTYAMTGWRIGYLGAPKIIAEAVGNFLSHINGNANSIAQKASLEAISGPQDDVHKMKEEFRKRRDRFVEGLNSIKGITCLKPKGAFYVYPNFSKLFTAEIKDSSKMADYLLEKAFIAAVPGVEFGTKEHIRFSYATSMETIEECIKRLKELFG